MSGMPDYEELSNTTTKHKTLISEFNRIIIHERSRFPSELGKILNSLARERNKCDYEANYHVDSDLAAYLYRQALAYGGTLKEYIETNFMRADQPGPSGPDEPAPCSGRGDYGED